MSGSAHGPDGLLRRFAARLLRIPLYHKLVGANVLLLLATLVGALWIGRGPSQPGPGPLLLGGLVVGIGAALNLALLRTALAPVKEIEETARRVERGDFGARAEASPVADRSLRRLTEVFNRMLDVVAEHRRQQRALTLRTFEREERDHAETARELRESTAQRVATLLLRLRAARAELTREGEPPPEGDGAVDAEPGTEQAREGSPAELALAECQELARETLDDLRRTARELRRPEIDDLGLVPALRAYASDLAGPDGPTLDFEEGSLRGCLSRETLFRLYRILQEAVANAVAHAAAGTVTLRLGMQEGTAFAEIRDDGTGFRTRRGGTGVPPRPEARSREAPRGGGAGAGAGGDGEEDGGLGLIAMRERARDLGAELTVESEPGRGTRVRVEIPCDRQA